MYYRNPVAALALTIVIVCINRSLLLAQIPSDDSSGIGILSTTDPYFSLVSEVDTINICTTTLDKKGIKDKDRIGLLSRRADAYSRLGNAEKAISDLRQIISIDGKSTSALSRLAQISYVSGKKEYFEIAKQLYCINPNNPTSLLLLYMHNYGDYYKQDQYDATAIERAINSDDCNPDCLFARTNILCQENNYKRIIDLIDKAIGNYERYRTTNTTCKAQLLLTRATAFYVLGEGGKAIEDLSMANKENLGCDINLRKSIYGLAWACMREYGTEKSSTIFAKKLLKEDTGDMIDNIYIDIVTHIDINNKQLTALSIKKYMDEFMKYGSTRAWLLSLFIYCEENNAEIYKALMSPDSSSVGKSLALNYLEIKAYFLSSCKDSDCRNGKEAVKTAKLLCDISCGNRAKYLMLYAMALAETGDFSGAVSYADKAVNKLPCDSDMRKAYIKRLNMFKSHIPYRIGFTDDTYDMFVY